jgi:hypothetical protein
MATPKISVKTEYSQETGLLTPDTTPQRRMTEERRFQGPLPRIISTLDFLDLPLTKLLISQAANLPSQLQAPLATYSLWHHIIVTYFFHHSNTKLNLALQPFNGQYGTMTFIVVRKLPNRYGSNSIRILLLVTAVAHSPWWDMIFTDLQLAERTFELNLKNEVLRTHGEVDVNWIFANAAVAELRTIRVRREGPLEVLEGPQKLDLRVPKERYMVGEWLQKLAEAARKLDYGPKIVRI